MLLLSLIRGHKVLEKLSQNERSEETAIRELARIGDLVIGGDMNDFFGSLGMVLA